MRLKHLGHALRGMLLLAAIGFAPIARASVDYTDIWFNAAESGWGVNLAQTNFGPAPSANDFIFATFFIYGPDGQPFWYAAQLFRAGTGETFTGVMYRVKGTWFGAPTFPPVKASDVTQVGQATFTATSSSAGTLSYQVDAVTVNKNIERQTTIAQNLTGSTQASVLPSDTYLGGISRSASGTCPGGTALLNIMQLIIFQSAPNTVLMQFFDGFGVLACVMQANPVQHGKVFSASGAVYQCTTGLNTTVDIASIRKLDAGIEVHWRTSPNSTCAETGRFIGITQQ